MVSSFDISGMLAVDAQGVDRLRLQVKTDPNQGLKAAAQQFEALFINMLLKSMREATPQDALFDSEQTRFYTSMLDQQLSQTLSSKGIGLADIMIRQLSRPVVADVNEPSATAPAPELNVAPTPERDVSAPIAPSDAASGQAAFDSEELFPVGLDRQLARSRVARVNQPSAPAATPAASTAPAPNPGALTAGTPRDFVSMAWPHARAASQATGVPTRFVVAQAALESDWGRHEIRRADGSPSFNLFGIKAGRNWSGPVVETATTEYVNGTPQKTVEKFRAYGSYAEAFRDYVNLLRSNPRYAAVLDHQDAAGFARGLQRAGYATDPMYADKLMRILNGNTLRQSLTA